MARWPSAGVKDRNPDAHEFCAPTKDAANFDLIYDRNQPTPVVDSGGDPIMSLGHVAEVDAAMPKRHGVFVALIARFANEFDGLAGSNLLVDIATAIDSFRRFASQFCYPPLGTIARCFPRAGPARLPAAAVVGPLAR